MNLSCPGALRFILPAAGLAGALLAQQPKQAAPKTAPKPIQAQSTSTISTSYAADGAQIVEIRNVTYDATSTNVPGRPRDERLLLRKTVHSKETLGDIGVDATVTLEAWRLGDDPREKPLYTLTIPGTDGHAMDNAIFVVSRGLEETEWWSAYKLATGQLLFDTYVPVLSFSISRDIVKMRYVGLQVPPDDTKDARLKQPNVVAVLSYASEDRLLKEALLTSDNRPQAELLRSYADVTHIVSLVEGTPVASAGKGKAVEPTRTLKLTFSQNYPSAANTVEVRIPIAGDDLDLAHAQLPASMHATAFRR
jgi:hypothetical protein